MRKKILYIQYTSPAAYPPLEHSSTLLADSGWRVLFLGTEAQGDSKNLVLPSHPHIDIQQLVFQSAGWQQKLHYLYFILWVVLKTIIWRPNWIYASDLFSCLPTVVISFFPRVKVIYHEHDSPDPFHKAMFIRLLLWFRKQLAKRAAITILPNEARADKFYKMLSPPEFPVVVWNCPMKAESNHIKQKQVADETLSLWYHGSIGPSRLPATLILALEKLPDTICLYVTGYETITYMGYIDELKILARKIGVEDRLCFLPAIPQREDLLKECKKHDIGISFMPLASNDINMQHMAGASNKPFDYLACGLALLVSDLPEWKSLYVETGYGLACNPEDPDSIVNSVHWYWENFGEKEMMAQRGHERIELDWNYEAQFLPVFERMMQQ